jgi:co-chaperonin GroES (HSP10)
MLKPIRNRVLVRPDAVESETAGGLIIPDNAKDGIVMSGEVVALGPECHGPSYRIRGQVLADVEHAIERVAGRAASASWTEDLLNELRAQLAGYYDLSQDVQVGAHVCFPYTAGTVLAEGGTSYLLVNEDDIVATWQPDEAVVEARVA